MCIVSMVTPTSTTDPWKPNFPWNTQPKEYGWPPLAQVDPEILNKLNEILKRLDELDRKVNATECKDEAKNKFFEEMAALLDKYRAEGKIE